MWLRILIAYAVLLLSPAASQANTITQPLAVDATIPVDIGGYGPTLIPSAPFQQFNPALGELDSVLIILTGLAFVENFSADPALISVWVTPSNDPVFTPPSGAEWFNGNWQIAMDRDSYYLGPFSIAVMSGLPWLTDYFVGPGEMNINLGVMKEPQYSSAFIASPGVPFEGIVRYSYIPSAPVPEPDSLALLAAGLVGLAVSRVRRHSRFAGAESRRLKHCP